MTNFPTGTITFLLTDVEGSTRLWEQHRDVMGLVLTRHDEIIENVAVMNNGLIVRPRGEGDSRFVVFERPGDAVRAAVEIQQALATGFADLPIALMVRIGIHTGAADWRDGDYYGSAVNRCARIRGLGHGGQTLLSQATAELVRDALPDGVALVDLGAHRLRGLSRPETVYQLWIPGLPNDFPSLLSSGSAAGNLPESPTPIIGRRRELAEITGLLAQDSVRFVTLTGPGGTGKTRLSLEVGRELLERFPHGVYFVDLAPITDPALVATTIAHTMGVREGGDRPPFDNLRDYLADKKLCLILDNLEQIVAAAPMIAGLLAAAPKLKMLATSRIPLQIRGEREYPVDTLPVPSADAPLSPEQLLDYGAVRLFVQQAQAARPNFQLSPENADAVASICRRLDGLPLAVEIAAARTRMLPPQAILKRLDRSMSLLVGGAADLPTRQQTVRGAIDWSFDLLQPEEQTLFCRLGVFVGGFMLENAEAICNQDGDLDVFNGVEVLLRNSLLRQVDSTTDEPRFDMLQTIRDYALEKLAQSGNLAELRRIHANHYVRETTENWIALYSSQAIDRLAYLEEEYDNYRAAIAWGLEPGNDVNVACRICVMHVWFWYRRGHFREGREWCERAVLVTEGTNGPARAMSLLAAAIMAVWQGDMKQADQRYEELNRVVEAIELDEIVAMAHVTYGVSLVNQGRDREAYSQLSLAAEQFDQAGGTWDKCTTLVHLANASLGLGQIKQAETWLQEALPLAKQIGDIWQIAFCLNNFGEVARVQGEYKKARDYYSESEALYREADAVGDHARLIHTMGYMALHDGDTVQAEERFLESLAAFRKLGNKRGLVECLAGLAAVETARADTERAVLLLSAAEAQMRASGAAWWPADRLEVERTRTALKVMLGEADFYHLWDRGQAMGLGEALTYAAESEHLTNIRARH